MSDMLFRCVNLHKNYGDVEALADVNFSLARGKDSRSFGT